MDTEEFETKLLGLIAECVPARFNKRALTTDTRLKQDLGIDSIGMIALLFRFEQAFEIDLSQVDIAATLAQLHTVGDTLVVGRYVLEKARAEGGV